MKRIAWLFRKKRDLGNFSIENSFSEVFQAWGDEVSQPQQVESSFFSEGFLNRVRMVFETARIKTSILHITGDIHFAALAWPKWKRNRPIVVLTIHDIGFLEDFKGIKKWMMQKFWVHWPLRCVDHLITVSEATKDAVLQEAPRFVASKISVIPSVVPQHFKPRSQEPSNPKNVALQIGLAKNKNLERHAEALRGLDIQLKIIGEPSDSVIKMLEAKGIDFIHQSKLTHAEMQEAYASSDFLLFASTLEGFGMPIIEAQMVGLPVITSNIDPMKEVAGEGAVLCNPMDHRSIRNAIETVTEDEHLREQIIQAGFENVKRFNPMKSVQLHQELYEKLTHAQS